MASVLRNQDGGDLGNFPLKEKTNIIHISVVKEMLSSIKEVDSWLNKMDLGYTGPGVLFLNESPNGGRNKEMGRGKFERADGKTEKSKGRLEVYAFDGPEEEKENSFLKDNLEDHLLGVDGEEPKRKLEVVYHQRKKQVEKGIWKVKDYGKMVGDGSGASLLTNGSAVGDNVETTSDLEEFVVGGGQTRMTMKAPIEEVGHGPWVLPRHNRRSMGTSQRDGGTNLREEAGVCVADSGRNCREAGR